MPRDGNLPEQNPPSRHDIVQAQRNSLVAQVLDLEADKAILQNDLTIARRRVAELEAQLNPAEPAHADD